MKTRLKYFLGYFIGSIIVVPVASFIDFAFGLNTLNFGLKETIGFAILLGLILGAIFGVVLKFNPIHFPWSPW